MAYETNWQWWVIALRGLLAILLGLVAFFMPGATLLSLILVFGVFAALDGVLGFMWTTQTHRWTGAIRGILGIAAAVAAFSVPGLTAMALLYIIAAWSILAGAVEIAAAIQLRKVIEGEWLLMLSGVLSILFGILIGANPAIGLMTVVFLFGAYMVALGVLLLSVAFRVRRELPYTGFEPREMAHRV